VRGLGVALALALTVTPGCLMSRYLAQASYGQFELLRRARPVDEVVRDPDTPLRTAMMLAEIPAIKRYGKAHGLRIRGNYEAYTELGRGAAVWFVGASDPVAFAPRRWCFPIVGCFAGLGWFDEDDALAHRASLERDGWDVIARPASAYSTGGWFADPVLSSMLGGGDDGLPGLANVILHESVHATVLVPDEPFFNESFAEYVADALTDRWVDDQFGVGSPEQVAWLVSQATHLARTARQLATFRELDALYKSAQPRAAKLAAKAAIIDRLMADLHLRRRPNNASMVELRVYNGGAAFLGEAHRACGDIQRLIRAAQSLRRADFTKTLQEDLTPLLPVLAARCRALP
jgi:predicted aminopeptidase